ncbi:MAG: TIGR03560 family F420-dependent LLM class oxidoreductase [Candidatus Rokubacteria bacterium]|nr:TIGR03560 family F420-dependent LLM class oxidoreductase [Candidatus Rokubacteria bacterium]
MKVRGRTVRFGAVLRQAGNRWERIAESARACDRLGFHSVHFIDHLLALPDPAAPILEAWTTMTAVAALTERVRFGVNVLSNSFRPPALLAKMGATLDVISGGRFELGIGAGWHEPEYRAYGFDFPAPAVRIGQLGEAVQLVKRLWTGEPTTYTGRYYRAHEAICQPRPVQRPRPPIIIGGGGERLLLRLVAEEADVWNCPGARYADFDRKVEALRRHCGEVGRDFDTVELSLQDLVVVAATEAAATQKLAEARHRFAFLGDIETLGTHGTPERCIETLRRKADQGISYFICLFTDGGAPETVRLFGERVLPAFA